MTWFPIEISSLILLVFCLISQHALVMYFLYRKVMKIDPNAMPDNDL
ncbi:hypothetical protein ACVR1I_03155 [Streptococcus cameli]